MDDFKNIALASTIVIGICEHAQRFGFPKKYLLFLNVISSILVSFLFIAPYNTKDFVISVIFLTFTSSGMNTVISKLGSKIDKSKKED